MLAAAHAGFSGNGPVMFGVRSGGETGQHGLYLVWSRLCRLLSPSRQPRVCVTRFVGYAGNSVRKQDAAGRRGDAGRQRSLGDHARRQKSFQEPLIALPNARHGFRWPGRFPGLCRPSRAAPRGRRPAGGGRRRGQGPLHRGRLAEGRDTVRDLGARRFFLQTPSGIPRQLGDFDGGAIRLDTLNAAARKG